MTKEKKTSMSGKKEYMFELWCEVNKLSSKNCSIAQICEVTGLSWKTAKKYAGITDREEAWNYFMGWHSRASPKKAKLAEYAKFFIEELTDSAGFSKAQIMDHFLERHPDAEPATKSTLNRYLDDLCQEEGIEKEPKDTRDFQRHDPEDWGEEAEVDFGEMEIYDLEKHLQKVFFILVVLKASCYKFVYFIQKKFDAIHAVYGLHLAFTFFDGRPTRVIFDQDPVFLNKANHGDFITTQALEQYAAKAGFKPVFCHPYNPQSKGRVEKYVDYVKRNFLKGRKFHDIHFLNEQALLWLNRTANKKVHSIWLRSPKEMFINDEKPRLKPYTCHVEDPDRESIVRSVNKDNTIRYEGSLIDVPPRTYKGKGTQVRVDIESNPQYILIKDLSGRVIVQYLKSDEPRFRYKLPNELLNKKMNRHERALREKLDQWEENEPLSRYIRDIREEKRNYANDTLRELKKIIEPLELGDAIRLVKHLADNRLILIKDVRKEMERLNIKEMQSGTNKGLLGRLDNSDFTPGSSRLGDYK